MFLFPAQADELLDRDALQQVYAEAAKTQDTPAEPELNYRTRPLSPEQELRLTLLLLFVPLPVLLVLSALLNVLIELHPLFVPLIVAAGLLLGGAAALRQLLGAQIRTPFVALVLLAAAFLCGRLWSWVDGIWWCRIALTLTWIVSSLIARQIAAWHVVGPTVDRDRLERWRGQLPDLLRPLLSLDCPEQVTFLVAPFLLAPAWWLAVRWAVESGQPGLWPLAFVVCLHASWWLWHLLMVLILPWPSWLESWRMTLHALTLFLTYDPHQTPAAGVFQFPSRWLRPLPVRWLLVLSALMALAFACGDALPSAGDAWNQGRSPVGQLLLNLLLLTVWSPLLLVTILWLIAGTTLARFSCELSRPAPDGQTPWDIYTDRLLNSQDPLEREHLLSGTARTGDFPVLIHREIYDQHLHLLGDSGASKTSLGMIPLATQLIARENASVVVVDLKGDKALFEACRLEAARTRKLRFRWLSNQVGHSSYVFNPFRQSHNQHLSLPQFVQEILQGLSLDHGIAYGAGYYTAMNEIVLSTVLQHCGARSFRELDRYLRDQRYYAKIGGHPEDWAQARNLGSLVTRLAASEAINVIPGMYPQQPEVLTDAIDAQNVLTEPQVVYLWLRSPVESSNAPAIPRLFLWAMFNAAGHHPPGKHRVYFLIDEFQQVVSEGIRLIFEQFRDLGGTLVAAHQAAGQLERHGSDLGDTVNSCTAVKQVFRASDLESLERLEKLSGSRLEKVAYWMQPREPGTGNVIDKLDPYHAVDGLVNVRSVEQPFLNSRELQAISSQRHSSLIRFTFGSGYTQFAGHTVPIVSDYSTTYPEYERRRSLPWPTAPGAFTIPANPMPSKAKTPSAAPPPVPSTTSPTVTAPAPAPSSSTDSTPAPSDTPAPPSFLDEFDRRGKPKQ